MSILKKMRKKGILDDLPPLSEGEQQRADAVKEMKEARRADDETKMKLIRGLASRREEEYEVMCMDDTGKGDLFDEGLTYIAKWHAMEYIIQVCDRNGEWQECIESRFNRVSAGN